MTSIPGIFTPVQQELINFNFPVGNAGITSIAAFLNGLLTAYVPVGTIVDSMLTEVQWNNALGNPSNPLWIIADGRNISGSLLSTLTGNNFAPNICGIMRRGKNNGRSDGNQNPDGDLSLGFYSPDKFGSHMHQYNTGGPFVTVAGPGPLGVTFASPFGPTFTDPTGANETAPKNITINPFVRIN